MEHREWREHRGEAVGGYQGSVQKRIESLLDLAPLTLDLKADRATVPAGEPRNFRDALHPVSRS